MQMQEMLICHHVIYIIPVFISANASLIKLFGNARVDTGLEVNRQRYLQWNVASVDVW